MRIENSDKPFLSLIIPAYNEQERIEATLVAVEAYLSSAGKSCEIIAVNDGSTDDTLRIIRERAAGSAFMRVVAYEVNRGKGYAVRQGVFASRGDYVAFTDADLSAPIDILARLFEALEKGFDIAIGSRAVKGVEIPRHQPWYREMGGKCLNLVIQALAVPGIHDTQCGLKLFRGDVAREVFAHCFLDGWGFDVEVLYLARKLGYSIAEVPVKWSHVEGSKVRPFRSGVEIIRDLIRMRGHHYDLDLIGS